MGIIKKISTGLEERTKTVRSLTRRGWLLGLGAVSLTKDTVEEQIEQLTRRSEKLENVGRKRVAWLERRVRGLEEQIDHQRDELTADIKDIRSTINKNVDLVLDRLNIPTSSDLAALDVRLGRLSNELRELVAQTEPEPVEGYTKLRVEEVLPLLRSSDEATVQRIRDYEAVHANRTTVMREADRLLNKEKEHTA